MLTITRASLICLCLFAFSFNTPAADQASVTSYLNKTATSITGYDAELKISFSSQLVDDGKTVLIDIQLANKRISNRVTATDPKNRPFELKTVNVKTGAVTSLSANELGSLKILKSNIGYTNVLVHSLLARTLELVLSTDPDGEDIDFSTEKFKEERANKTLMNLNSSERFASICPNLGQTLVGQYTLKIRGNEQTIVEQAVVGPCYSGECLGRCGPGCGGEQSYTQECFNHDLCAGATGKNMGPCRDEFAAAADGYFSAPDCADMGGQWTDNYAFGWSFSPETIGGSIVGTVATTACGNWKVTGNRSGQAITLTATNPAPSIGCCTAFTYTGTAQCSSANGRWTNVCGGSGSWNMQRNGTAVSGAKTLPIPVGPSPTASQ